VGETLLDVLAMLILGCNIAARLVEQRIKNEWLSAKDILYYKFTLLDI
jgi:hypothetical protein